MKPCTEFDNLMRSRCALFVIVLAACFFPIRAAAAVRDLSETPVVTFGPLTGANQHRVGESTAPSAPIESSAREEMSTRKVRNPLVPANPAVYQSLSTNRPIDGSAIEVRSALPVEPSEKLARFNAKVLELLKRMPKGGKYATSAKATANLKAAIERDKKGRLKIDPGVATPSFCSSATYLVFLMMLQSEGALGASESNAGVIEALLFRHQDDGVGVWGRWNANGPGTGRLFQETKLGRNFDDINEAMPGDFLKVWWTDEIGHKERGHSVIYLGLSRAEDEQPKLKFWSSNIPDGYGEKEVPISSVKHMLFSRLTNLSALRDIPKLKDKDEYLAAMKERGSSWQEVKDKAGVGMIQSLKRTYSMQSDREPSP